MDHTAIRVTSYATLDSARETHLGLRAKMYAITESAALIRLAGVEDLQRFYMEAVQLLMKVDFMERLIAPVPGKYYPHIIASH